MLGQRIAKLRKREGLSQYELADRLGFSRGKLANYEQGSRQPDYETLQVIASYFDVSIDFLVGKSENEKPEFQEKNFSPDDKEEKDIAKRLEQIKNEIEHSDGLAFDGEPMSEEAMESLMEAMEHIVRQTKRINKKYIPKKYSQNQNNE